MPSTSGGCGGVGLGLGVGACTTTWVGATQLVSRRLLWISLVIVILVAQLLPEVRAIHWLAVGKWNKKHWNKTSECSKKNTYGSFVKTQRQICQRNLKLMPTVALASQQTVAVCQELFKDRRWNCSSITKVPNYMPDLTGGSREQAFVYALSAASLTHNVARACAQGVTTKCGCSPIPNTPPPENFKWGGCGDDIRYGIIFGGAFTDAPFINKKKSKFSKPFEVIKHNNGVGRKIIYDSISTTCKCHGVSGSCNIKTCWKALPDMRTIGSLIQQKYGVAVEVQTKKVRDKETKKRVRTLVPIYQNKKSFADDELIYYTASPDYCYPDSSLGSLGTYGRQCDMESTGSGGCRSMCCGRGYTTKTVTVKYRCECKYYWCCYVKCKTCTKTVDIHRCR